MEGEDTASGGVQEVLLNSEKYIKGKVLTQIFKHIILLLCFLLVSTSKYMAIRSDNM
jgi:hypothetical protein